MNIKPGNGFKYLLWTKNYVIGDQGNELFKACYRFIFTDEGNNYEILDEIWKLILYDHILHIDYQYSLTTSKIYRYLALEKYIGNWISTHFNYPYIYQFIYDMILDKILNNTFDNLLNHEIYCIQIIQKWC